MRYVPGGAGQIGELLRADDRIREERPVVTDLCRVRQFGSPDSDNRIAYDLRRIRMDIMFLQILLQCPIKRRFGVAVLQLQRGDRLCRTVLGPARS